MEFLMKNPQYKSSIFTSGEKNPITTQQEKNDKKAPSLSNTTENIENKELKDIKPKNNDLSKKSCQELGQHLRWFMRFNFSNNDISKRPFYQLASYAPIHDVDDYKHECEEAEEVYDAFMSKGCK